MRKFAESPIGVAVALLLAIFSFGYAVWGSTPGEVASAIMGTLRDVWVLIPFWIRVPIFALFGLIAFDGAKETSDPGSAGELLFAQGTVVFRYLTIASITLSLMFNLVIDNIPEVNYRLTVGAFGLFLMLFDVLSGAIRAAYQPRLRE